MVSKTRNPAKPLTPQQEKFCQLRAGGEMSKTDCYLTAYPRTKKAETARVNYQRLEKDPRISARIKELMQATETDLVLGRQEKREFLARVVRANFKSIDPDDPEEENADLIESITRRYNKDGDHIATTIKLPSKATCIEIDNRMAGHNEPEEHLHKHEGGVMLVPTGGGTMDEWEKEAVRQQQELQEAGQKKTPGK